MHRIIGTAGCRHAWMLLLALLTFPASGAEPGPQLVTHADQAGVQQLPLATARAMFSMRLRSWPDGTPVRVFVLPSQHPVHQKFCRDILRMFPYKLELSWERLLYSGTGQAPETVSSLAELQQRLAATPGGVGYLPAQLIPSDETRFHVIPVR